MITTTVTSRKTPNYRSSSTEIVVDKQSEFSYMPPGIKNDPRG